MRRFSQVISIVAAVAVGAAGAVLWLRPPPKPALPGGPAVITQMREAARLETLELSLYKKVVFTPDPPPASDSVWRDVVSWARYNLQNPHGRAILFAKVHLGLDLSKLDPDHVRVQGDRVLVVLPPVSAQVELLPGETEIIDSNLDSQQTAQLLEAAKHAFEAEVLADPQLRERARGSGERALRGLVLSLGFREVQVVDSLPPRAGS